MCLIETSAGNPVLCAPLANFCFTQRCPTASHNALGGSDEFVKGVQVPRVVAAPSEWRDVFGLKPASVYVAAGSDDGSSIEHGVDAAFAVVAHQHATKLQSAIDVGRCCFIPQPHFAVIAFEVAGIGVGAEVAPFADNGVAQKSVVAFVAVSQESTIRHFTSNAAVRTYARWTVDARSHFDHGRFTYSEWTTDVCPFLDFHAGPYKDWS